MKNTNKFKAIRSIAAVLRMAGIVAIVAAIFTMAGCSVLSQFGSTGTPATPEFPLELQGKWKQIDNYPELVITATTLKFASNDPHTLKARSGDTYTTEMRGGRQDKATIRIVNGNLVLSDATQFQWNHTYVRIGGVDSD